MENVLVSLSSLHARKHAQWAMALAITLVCVFALQGPHGHVGAMTAVQSSAAVGGLSALCGAVVGATVAAGLVLTLGTGGTGFALAYGIGLYTIGPACVS